jgi:beta-glucosidase-like glycosyl hydrolase
MVYTLPRDVPNAGMEGQSVSKKNRARRSSREAILEDKPDYAMDRMQKETVAKPQAETVPEQNARVEEFLQANALQRLKALKTAMQQDEAPSSPKQVEAAPRAESKKQRTGKSAAEKLSEQPDASFAELFDPVEDEETSFADMLGDSKLDWRYFKS